jgi:hypothetical protein
MPKNPPDDPEQLDTLRYHAIGNAVTVNVSKWLALRISRYLDTNCLPAQTVNEKVPAANVVAV